MNTIQHAGFGAERANIFARFFKGLVNRISHLFEPEEVEVTFRRDGNKITYTYTKVSHK
jgi:hypothetical protein